jgi:hypothetical protein
MRSHLRKRLGLYAGIAAGAIAIGVVGAVITRSRDSSRELDPSTPAGAANEALEHGDLPRALQILDANKATIGDDPDAQLVLGHVRAARNESGLALAAYDQALALDPELDSDGKLRAGLRAMADGADPAVVAQTLDMWLRRTSDAEAKRLLLRAAVSQDLGRRKAVRPVIERHKLGDSVDWMNAYSLDLQQEASCEGRREAVSKLRALGDARAIPALERARAKTGKSGKNINGCLLDDAKAAIAYLQGLSRK